MIVKRSWTRRNRGKHWADDERVYHYTGYFLFGFIPLWIERN